MTKSISIIILNYNGYSDTMECVESLRKSIPPETVDYQIIVVDNHSKDNSCDLMKKTLPEDVILLAAERNGGYACGNNIGISYALEHGADYICILNNDTVITEDYLSPCIELLDKDKDIAFVGPMLMNYDNDLVQNTGGRLSIVKGKSYWLNGNVPEASVEKALIECDTVFGAALLFRSSLIHTIGLMPEDYFLFYEETEWCCKAKKAGFKNCVNTRTKIIHKKSESLKTMSEMQLYLMERNRTLFVKRNGSPLQFFAFLVFNFGRLLFRAITQKIPLGQYLRFQLDGITERYDPRYVRNRDA